MPGRSLPEKIEETPSGAVFRIEYPSLTRDYSIFDFNLPRYYLTKPIEKDFVAISFAAPTDLASIDITGDGAENIEIFFRRVNEKLGYDDHTVLPFGEKYEGKWIDDSPDRITTIFIHADCKNDDGALLTLRVTAG